MITLPVLACRESGRFLLAADLRPYVPKDALRFVRVVRSSSPGSTAGSSVEVDLSCGLNPGSAVAYTWTAPANASYQLDTYGSDYDTVLGVLLGDCEEDVCDDDGDGDRESDGGGGGSGGSGGDGGDDEETIGEEILEVVEEGAALSAVVLGIYIFAGGSLVGLTLIVRRAIVSRSCRPVLRKLGTRAKDEDVSQ